MGSPYWNTPAGGPAGPLNAFALPAPDPRVTRLLWDDPGVMAVNSAFYVVGVHVYRSDASDRGPYYRVTPFPLGGTYFEDGPRLHRVERERIPWEGGWSLRGQSGSGERWVLKTREPIVVPGEFAPGQAPVYSSDAHDVAVWVDGTAVPVDRVFGRGHEIEVVLADDLDPVPSRTVTYPQPGPASVVEASYFTTRGWTPSPSLETWTWYRVSTVAVDPQNPVAYLESNLDHCKPFSKLLVEETDYVWREAVRRNGWILQQGGERVKIFNRRINGIPCTCTRDARTLEYARQPEAMCLRCYGTGFVGGYEGPFDTVIAPDDAPRRLARTPWGRHKEHSYDIFFGPVPLVRQGDLVVKQSGERYLIGPTHRPTNRGALLQQHTTLSFVDEGDVRYRVPTYGVLLPAPETRDVDIVEPRLPVTGEVSYDEEEGWAGPPFPVGPRHFVPMVTDDPAKPEGEQFRGRSRPWSNIMRGFFPFWIPLLWELQHGLHHAVSWFV